MLTILRAQGSSRCLRPLRSNWRNGTFSTRSFSFSFLTPIPLSAFHSSSLSALTHLVESCRLSNGSRELLVPNRGRVSKVIIRPTKPSTFAAHRPHFKQPPSETPTAEPARVGVNKKFLHELSAIFRILIPRWHSKEVWLIGLHTSFLILRTYLSLLVAKLDGKLVGDLVGRSVPLLFLKSSRFSPAGFGKRTRLPQRSLPLVRPRRPQRLHQ
jgi:hypothetical protein